MTILPKVISRFNAMSIKFFTELEQNILQFVWKHKRSWIAKSTLRKKNGARRINLPDFRLHHSTTVLKTVMVSTQKQKYRSMEQDRKSRHKPTHLWSPNLWQRKNIQERKDSLFSRWCWGNWVATCKWIKLEYFLTPYTKISSKWIKDFNARPETMKLLEENIGRRLFDIISARSFLTHLLEEWKLKINNWDLIKGKSFFTAKETINKMKGQPSEWEEIFANEATDNLY